MTLNELFCRNLKLILDEKGLNYSNLTELCRKKGMQVGQTSLNLLRYPEKCNPTLETVEKIAIALNVNPRLLIHEHLDYNGTTEPGEGYLRRECVLSLSQNVTVERWEEVNKTEIKLLNERKLERYRKLHKEL